MSEAWTIFWKLWFLGTVLLHCSTPQSIGLCQAVTSILGITDSALCNYYFPTFFLQISLALDTLHLPISWLPRPHIPTLGTLSCFPHLINLSMLVLFRIKAATAELDMDTVKLICISLCRQFVNHNGFHARPSSFSSHSVSCSEGWNLHFVLK